MRTAAILLLLCTLEPCHAQPQPSLTLRLTGQAESVMSGGWPRCDRDDIPDAPARAVRLADGTVELYVSDQVNRINVGPDLRRLRHECGVVFQGAHDADPAAFNDRAWIATPWTEDGRTVWAVIHDEFHGNDRPWLCPTQRYMDCWYNALTLAVSGDGGRHFRNLPGPGSGARKPALVATLPYRYDELERGHHGYFNPTNIIRRDGRLFMFAFATRANAQQEGNCLLRGETIARPDSWRGWNGTDFSVRFVDPYAAPTVPAEHVCAPVAPNSLRWPVTSLVRHAPSGQYVALMQNGARGGGVYYATSPDLLQWSAPALLMPAIGLGAWTCADPQPLAYPSLLDADSPDPNFQTVADQALLFATSFDVTQCQVTGPRDLKRWNVQITTK